MSRRATSPDEDLAKWCAVLSEGKPVEQVPPGWLTAKQIAHKTGKAESTIGTQICRAVAEERCERREFRIRTGSMVRPVPHYRPLSK